MWCFTREKLIAKVSIVFKQPLSAAFECLQHISNRFRSTQIIIIIRLVPCARRRWCRKLHKIKFPRDFAKTFVITTVANFFLALPTNHRQAPLSARVRWKFRIFFSIASSSGSTATFAYRLRLLRRLERTTFNCQNQINLTTMDYLKSFWWKPTTKDEPQPNVEFSTITTSAPVNSAYFSIIHEVKTSGENRQSNATSNDLPSPNESFHTVKSSFNETPSSMGVSNLGYTGSHQDVTTSKSASTQPQTSTFTHQHQQPSNHQLSSDTYI